jgi:hypothetical protein
MREVLSSSAMLNGGPIMCEVLSSSAMLDGGPIMCEVLSSRADTDRISSEHSNCCDVIRAPFNTNSSS